MSTPRAIHLAALAAAACTLGAASADAASRFTVRGAGFGHGVGMSQYGAYGYALHGWSYDKILAHYYTGTALGQAGSKTVRVLLKGSVSRATVSNAASVNSRRLKPSSTYYVRHGSRSGAVALVSRSGHRLKQTTGVLKVRGSGGRIALGGAGAYRGSLEFRASGTLGVQGVNALGMESYVRGVVSRESPASWPAAALQAQAVAARTYALTTSKGGGGFDQYADTRSQVYGGLAAESAATDAATKATKGQVVTYAGEPVVTYFFSTSGGQTEDVENTSLGNEPLPWLKSVDDPYDNASPKHRWGPYKWTLSATDHKLGSLVKGSFKGIDVIERGSSPRIVAADIVGSRGRTRVSGATIRARLGLFDSWAYFTSIKTGVAPKAEPDAAPPASGGAMPEARLAANAKHRLTGEVFPAVKNSDIFVDRREAGEWVEVGTAATDRRGRYAFLADRPGRYRVRFLIDVGPTVRVR